MKEIPNLVSVNSRLKFPMTPPHPLQPRPKLEPSAFSELYILPRSEFVGPKPIFFSRDPLASEAALAARPEAIKRGLLLLLHRIAEGVPVHLDEALAVVEQPRD